jgi:hypothetical protein
MVVNGFSKWSADYDEYYPSRRICTPSTVAYTYPGTSKLGFTGSNHVRKLDYKTMNRVYKSRISGELFNAKKKNCKRRCNELWIRRDNTMNRTANKKNDANNVQM